MPPKSVVEKRKRRNQMKKDESNGQTMRESKKIWTHDLSKQLFTLYREREFLWLRSHHEYRDMIKRNAAEEEIGQLLGFSVQEIKEKWRNMEEAFLQLANLEQDANNGNTRFCMINENENHELDNKPISSAPSASPVSSTSQREVDTMVDNKKLKLNEDTKKLEVTDKFNEGGSSIASDLRMIERLFPGEGEMLLVDLKLSLADRLRELHSQKPNGVVVSIEYNMPELFEEEYLDDEDDDY